MPVKTQERRWMGTAQMLLRTRRARRRKDAGAVLRAVARGRTGAVGLSLRGRHVLLVLDPELAGELLSGQAANTTKGPGLQRARPMLGEGLLTSEGAAHQRARRLVAPAFAPRRLDGYVEIFGRCTRDFTASWSDGARRNVHADMGALTLQTAGESLLGVDLAAQAARVREGLDAALAAFAAASGMGAGALGRRGAGGLALDPDGEGAATIGGGARAVHQLVDNIIGERRATASDDRGDVVSALLAASDEPGGLTAGEVHDHVMTLLLAGHETTASTLSWALYLLGEHPLVQRRLQAEADALGDRAVGAADLPGLRYTRAVVSEATRLYPPAWIIGRSVTADLTLDGWRLPAGSIAAVSPLLLHHDPRWYPDPERFDPERWLGDRSPVPRHAFLPFGTGPRACIGEQFAWSEAVAVLATLARAWTFEAVPGFRPALSYQVTLRPSGGIPMTVRARESGR
jgi:cytochrome P450